MRASPRSRLAMPPPYYCQCSASCCSATSSSTSPPKYCGSSRPGTPKHSQATMLLCGLVWLHGQWPASTPRRSTRSSGRTGNTCSSSAVNWLLSCRASPVGRCAGVDGRCSLCGCGGPGNRPPTTGNCYSRCSGYVRVVTTVAHINFAESQFGFGWQRHS